MESKRKNVYITIFVITTIVAATLAVYFGLEYKKLKEDNSKQDVSVKESTSLDEKNEDKGEVAVKEVEKIVEKETQLSQENIDKIAYATIDIYLQLVRTIWADPLNATIKLGFYKDYDELIKNTQNINGIEKTTVKYDEFVNKITKYMTKELFEEYVERKVFVNVDGYLANYAGGASGTSAMLEKIELQDKNNDEFTYSVTYYILGGFENVTAKETTQTIKVKKVNDDYVVSSKS